MTVTGKNGLSECESCREQSLAGGMTGSKERQQGQQDWRTWARGAVASVHLFRAWWQGEGGSVKHT